MTLQQWQYQLVEKDPFVKKELIEEDAHVLARYDRGKQSEDPLACVHVRADIALIESDVELG